jgi:hypothetical protein
MPACRTRREIDIVPRFGMPVDVDRRAIGGNRHGHKEVYVADDIAAVEPELRQGLDQIGEAAMRATDAVA